MCNWVKINTHPLYASTKEIFFKNTSYSIPTKYSIQENVFFVKISFICHHIDTQLTFNAQKHHYHDHRPLNLPKGISGNSPSEEKIKRDKMSVNMYLCAVAEKKNFTIRNRNLCRSWRIQHLNLEGVSCFFIHNLYALDSSPFIRYFLSYLTLVSQCCNSAENSLLFGVIVNIIIVKSTLWFAEKSSIDVRYNWNGRAALKYEMAN